MGVGLTMTAQDVERFWAKVDKTPTCWNWTAYVAPEGYGRFGLDGDTLEAHRVSFFLANGHLPKITDHLCRNKKCVRPDHLEEVTPSQNIRRSKGTDTHCKNGHPRTEWNTMYTGSCRLCQYDARRRWRLSQRQKEETTA